MDGQAALDISEIHASPRSAQRKVHAEEPCADPPLIMQDGHERCIKPRPAGQSGSAPSAFTSSITA